MAIFSTGGTGGTTSVTVTGQNAPGGVSTTTTYNSSGGITSSAPTGSSSGSSSSGSSSSGSSSSSSGGSSSSGSRPTTSSSGAATAPTHAEIKAAYKAVYGYAPRTTSEYAEATNMATASKAGSSSLPSGTVLASTVRYDAATKTLRDIATGQTIATNVVGYTTVDSPYGRTLGQIETEKNVAGSGMSRTTYDYASGKVTGISDKGVYYAAETGKTFYTDSGSELNPLIGKDKSAAAAIGVNYSVPKEMLPYTDWYAGQVEQEARTQGAASMFDALTSNYGEYFSAKQVDGGYEISLLPGAMGAEASLERAIDYYGTLAKYSDVKETTEGTYLITDKDLSLNADYSFSKEFGSEFAKGGAPVGLSTYGSDNQVVLNLSGGSAIPTSEMSPSQLKAFENYFSGSLGLMAASAQEQVFQIRAENMGVSGQQSFDTGIKFENIAGKGIVLTGAEKWLTFTTTTTTEAPRLTSAMEGSSGMVGPPAPAEGQGSQFYQLEQRITKWDTALDTATTKAWGNWKAEQETRPTNQFDIQANMDMINEKVTASNLNRSFGTAGEIMTSQGGFIGMAAGTAMDYIKGPASQMLAPALQEHNEIREQINMFQEVGAKGITELPKSYYYYKGEEVGKALGSVTPSPFGGFINEAIDFTPYAVKETITYGTQALVYGTAQGTIRAGEMFGTAAVGFPELVRSGAAATYGAFEKNPFGGMPGLSMNLVTGVSQAKSETFQAPYTLMQKYPVETAVFSLSFLLPAAGGLARTGLSGAAGTKAGEWALGKLATPTVMRALGEGVALASDVAIPTALAYSMTETEMQKGYDLPTALGRTAVTFGLGIGAFKFGEELAGRGRGFFEQPKPTAKESLAGRRIETESPYPEYVKPNYDEYPFTSQRPTTLTDKDITLMEPRNWYDAIKEIQDKDFVGRPTTLTDKDITLMEPASKYPPYEKPPVAPAEVSTKPSGYEYGPSMIEIVKPKTAAERLEAFRAKKLDEQFRLPTSDTIGEFGGLVEIVKPKTATERLEAFRAKKMDEQFSSLSLSDSKVTMQTTPKEVLSAIDNVNKMKLEITKGKVTKSDILPEKKIIDFAEMLRNENVPTGANEVKTATGQIQILLPKTEVLPKYETKPFSISEQLNIFENKIKMPEPGTKAPGYMQPGYVGEIIITEKGDIKLGGAGLSKETGVGTTSGYVYSDVSLGLPKAFSEKPTGIYAGTVIEDILANYKPSVLLGTRQLSGLTTGQSFVGYDVITTQKTNLLPKLDWIVKTDTTTKQYILQLPETKIAQEPITIQGTYLELLPMQIEKTTTATSQKIIERPIVIEKPIQDIGVITKTKVRGVGAELKTTLLPPILPGGAGSDRKKKKKKYDFSLGKPSRDRSMYSDLRSMAHTQLYYGSKGISPSLKQNPKLWKYETKGYLPTKEMLTLGGPTRFKVGSNINLSLHKPKRGRKWI